MATQLLAGGTRFERRGSAATPTRLSRVGVVLSTLALALFPALIAAPPAGATVLEVSVTPDLNAGFRVRR